MTTIGQIAVINGTVANPEDASQAQQIVRAMLNPGIKEGDPLLVVPVNRLKVATPLQVTLKVRIAEINRSVLKQMGVNLLATDPSSGFRFGIAQGQGIALPEPGEPRIPSRRRSFATCSARPSRAAASCSASIMLELARHRREGRARLDPRRAEPDRGDRRNRQLPRRRRIPDPGVGRRSARSRSTISHYGVGLAFTPIVLGDGRISMRVRPEVSELSNEGSITLNGFNVPALTTRRAETTVELGSGQSFMIAGLLRNTASNSVDKAPFLGDIPILGALFRSTQFRKQETELVVIVTPYLVRPVSGQMAVSTDGYRAPDDAARDFMGQTYQGVSGSVQPRAVAAPPVTAPATAAAAAAPGFKL